MAALAAWQRGEMGAGAALALLQPIASGAADFSNLGALLRADGRMTEAEAAHRHAIALDPTFAAAQYNLGNLLVLLDRIDEAETAYRAAVAVNPKYAEAWNALGTVLQRQGCLAAAVEAFRAAIHHAPRWPDAYANLGVALLGVGEHEAAQQALHAALTVDPRHAVALGNLAAVYLRAGAPVAAEAACRQAIALAPDEPRWLTNLSVALQMQARHAESEACCRRAMAMRPADAAGHGNLLFALNYRDDVPAEAIFAEYHLWNAQHAAGLGRSAPHDLDRTPDRRLRVGYVSPDFRQHAVALFAEPLLGAHDRSTFERFCYADVAVSDATTERLRGLADHWRDTTGQSDADLAATVERDRIDVLVDLAGHSAGNRLLTFARRPAPVQVCYLLGHGYTSGLTAMDAFLADEHLTPPGADALFSERIIRLPRVPFAYLPPDDMPPIAPLPAARDGCVSFGYFSRTERLNDTVIAAWARILREVPGSRLVLNNRPFQERACRTLFTKRFAAHGIDPARLELIYSSPQPEAWAAYANIDIALDPFPHNAGTTTIEALWQGVPVVSLAARPSVGRFGASILHAIDADEWVAHDEDAYVTCAVQLASDLDALAQTRAGLRERVAASPLRDADDLARHIERAYRVLWQEWCEGDTARLHRLYASDAQATRTEAERLITRDPRHGEAHHVLALLDYREQRFADADQHMQRARAAISERAELPANHAAILRMLGRLSDAEAAARAALQSEPDNVAAHNNLGNILRDAGRYDESATCYRHAVRLAPRFTDAWVNLAWVLALAGHAREAEHAARQAIDCDAGNANAHNNLGLALMRQGRLAEAEAALHMALALRPDFALPHSNILFCLNYRPELSAEAIFAEYRDWDRRHALPLLPGDQTFDIEARQERRLRVGYVSPDFRQHAVALFAEPLLAAHDRTSVELFCYAEVPAPDAVTRRFEALADHWRPTVGMSDADLAALIRQDRIDVLVDLAGHTAGNRLQVFARRPAPVEVSYLLGHGYTSGLSAMDAFLADEMLAPDGSEALFSERLVRLTRIPLAYWPPDDMPPVSPSPMLANGHITFGYFGRTVRLNDAVIEAWARILLAVPGARLMLNSAPFAEPSGCEQMAARFAAFGIGRERLDLVCTSPQTRTWAAYDEIDIALDPFPHNAGTTTIEALWQGVPVVSLVGRPTVGRFGAAILHAIGLDEWLTQGVEKYVARAIDAATDRATLVRLRENLRARFASSPLRDEAGLAREIEAAYRALWDAWHSGDALVRLGHQLLRQQSPAQAETMLRQALAANEDNAEAHETLAALLGQSGRLIEAETHHRAALRGINDRHRALNNLGVVLQAQGRPGEAEDYLREALALRSDYATAHSNLLFALNYRADLSPQQIFDEYRQWNRTHAAPLMPRQLSFAHGGDHLRVGYVSADFRRHSAALFAEPLLAAHDHTAIELFCYADVAVPDEMTERFRALADHWRPLTGLDDAAAADLIRQDGIDVLVDMTGHTGGSRLLAFARKPAPVLIAYLLGHGYTTGLTAMDAFLADDMLVPTGAETLFSERVVRLARPPLVYAPPDAMPDVAPLPALANGYVSFGYFGRLERLNATVVATWSRILASLPGSRLLLNSQPLREAAFRDAVATRFAAHGIGRDRLELMHSEPQPRTWAAYGAVDIALDPFPHNAGTTTIEALWQGAPVVSLASRPSVGRFGAMILHAIGADDWVAQDTGDYVARALALASDRDALAVLRHGLRQRVAASPLLDATGLARALEATYRALWLERCAALKAA
jgi:predicted O-linked N-acetylglucosamine transferase (SPINDLY family)